MGLDMCELFWELDQWYNIFEMDTKHGHVAFDL